MGNTLNNTLDELTKCHSRVESAELILHSAGILIDDGLISAVHNIVAERDAALVLAGENLSALSDCVTQRDVAQRGCKALSLQLEAEQERVKALMAALKNAQAPHAKGCALPYFSENDCPCGLDKLMGKG